MRAIVTYAGLPVPYVDLRVDLADEPVAELRRILDWHEPLLDYYQERLDNPEIPLHKDWLKQRNIERQFGRHRHDRGAVQGQRSRADRRDRGSACMGRQQRH